MSLQLDRVTVRFRRFEALSAVTLSVSAGSRVAVVGESGAGKSTLLNVAAGLVIPSHGTATVLGSPPDTGASLQRVGYVFQTDALFPHLTIRQNVELPLRARRWSATDSSARIDELLDLAGLREQAAKKPAALSGGQRQRASIVRALAPSPSLLLLDEPFASLDGPLRRRLRELVIGERLACQERTMILVTHDPEEALAFGQRIVILRDGRVVADGKPEDLYWRPSNAYVAGLLGECNVLDGFVSDSMLTLPGVGQVPLKALGHPRIPESSNVKVFIRPEALEVRANSSPPAGRASEVTATVTQVRDTGRFLSLSVQPLGSSRELRADLLGGGNFIVGASVLLTANWGRVHIPLSGEP